MIIKSRNSSSKYTFGVGPPKILKNNYNFINWALPRKRVTSLNSNLLEIRPLGIWLSGAVLSLDPYP